MPSREQIATGGKIFMLMGFLNIISLLIPLPDPLSILMRPFVGLIGTASGFTVLALTGGLGFLTFLIGFEMWERNRVTADEI